MHPSGFKVDRGIVPLLNLDKGFEGRTAVQCRDSEARIYDTSVQEFRNLRYTSLALKVRELTGTSALKALELYCASKHKGNEKQLLKRLSGKASSKK